MPTYQYVCTECGGQLEAVQKFTDEPLTVCAVCGGRLRKVFSPVGIVFKGSGFYRTDSRNGSVAASDKSDKSDKKDKQPSESPGMDRAKSSESASGSNGTADKKSNQTASASSKPSSEKVA